LSASPTWYRLACVAWCAVLVSACSFPGHVKPTIKVGLSAPFEGRFRDVGYEVLHAVRLAVRQRNEAGGVGARYLVEWVALNDFAEVDEAVTQAQKLGIDDAVMGVLGGLAPEAAAAAAQEYERWGLAFLHPGVDLTEMPSSPMDVAFAAEYRALSGGVPPGQAAVWAFAETNRLLETVDAVVVKEGRPSRQAVWQLLAGNQ